MTGPKSTRLAPRSHEAKEANNIFDRILKVFRNLAPVFTWVEFYLPCQGGKRIDLRNANVSVYPKRKIVNGQ